MKCGHINTKKPALKSGGEVVAYSPDVATVNILKNSCDFEQIKFIPKTKSLNWEKVLFRMNELQKLLLRRKPSRDFCLRQNVLDFESPSTNLNKGK